MDTVILTNKPGGDSNRRSAEAQSIHTRVNIRVDDVGRAARNEISASDVR